MPTEYQTGLAFEYVFQLIREGLVSKKSGRRPWNGRSNIFSLVDTIFEDGFPTEQKFGHSHNFSARAKRKFSLLGPRTSSTPNGRNFSFYESAINGRLNRKKVAP